MWRSNRPVHCNNKDLRLERHISESATLRIKWARAHLLREICTMGSERGDEYKRLRPVGEGTGSKESEYSEAPQRATTSRLVPTHQQDHRAIKRRCASMAGFKSFANAAITIAGIELAHRIRKGQFSFGRGRRRRDRSRKAEWAMALA